MPELEFIRITVNHGEYKRELTSLGQVEAAQDVEKFANHVALCWLRLALDHLGDARYALTGARTRAAYSRSYYAAYNASKALRYIVGGAVSLKGDDHSKASSDLPDDFPNVEKWSEVVTQLYEHRLRAGYDNWIGSAGENTLTPESSLELAEEFVGLCRTYLSGRLGVSV